MALMDKGASAPEEDSAKQSVQTAKFAVDKATSGASKLVSHHNNSILRSNEKAANSMLHTADNGSVLKSGGEEGSKLRNKEKSSVLRSSNEKNATKLLSSGMDSSGSSKLKNNQSSALKIDGQHRGNERLMARFMPDEQRIEKNSMKIDKIDTKLNKTMKNRYYRDYKIKGGIKSPLRIEASMKSKLRPTSLEKATGAAGGIAKSGLNKGVNLTDQDELGIQKAWADTASKAAGAASAVYKVSKTAKYWRGMRNEMKAASLLRKEEKLMRSTFKAEYRQAFDLFKASGVGKASNLLEKQKYKKFLKRKYMKNAMKQYRAAKKAGEASKTVFSTGLSLADKLKSVGGALFGAFKKLLTKKATWVVLLGGSSVMLLPVIMSLFLNLLVGMMGGADADNQQQTGQNVPEQVVQWREFVEERCKANNDPKSKTDLTKFVNAILATIWQESGGNPDSCSGDVMQCKACGLWDDSKMPSDWSEAQKSIDVGIRYFYNGLKSWGVTDPEDYDGLQIVAQGYNYGFAFLGWMKEKGKSKWTKELSALYSAERCAETGWTSYGHVPYGEEWLEKYKGANSDGEGDGKVVKEKGVEGVLKTALNQEGITENPSGSNNVIFNTAFYGHEVSGDGYPWCCAFVWWCFEKSGNGNLVPKTAGCAYMESHISEYGGKKITKMTDAKRGDLVIFRGGQHIGIVVENKGNGNLVTIEGNTTPENGTGSEYNGGCVAKRNRNISASGITAVLRPKYPTSSATTTEEKGSKATTESKKK